MLRSMLRWWRPGVQRSRSARVRGLARAELSPEQQIEQRDCARLIERVVLIAALGRLNTGRTPQRTPALRDAVARDRQPALRILESGVGDPSASRAAVV